VQEVEFQELVRELIIAEFFTTCDQMLNPVATGVDDSFW
jgi:hypothetical protein